MGEGDAVRAAEPDADGDAGPLGVLVGDGGERLTPFLVLLLYAAAQFLRS